ncbi:MAG: amidohydrolase family protein, partial [Clostridia bacterium]|nr:amidohydrolase family protein [Clostridia bacterium]
MKTAIKCGMLFDSNTKKVLENMLIVVEGDKIVDVLPIQNADTNEMNVIDLSDKFVMAGLIDGHVHIGMSGQGGNSADSVRRFPGEDALTSLKNAQTDLMAGFTTLRDCGANSFNDVSVRNSINKGEFIGPRLFVCGASMGSTGGHCDSHYAPQLVEATPKHHIIDGVDSAYHAARYNIKYGADFLKFMATGGVMSFGTTVGAQQLTYEEMRAICEIADM